MQTPHRGVVLVRPPGPRLAEGIVTHVRRRPVDPAVATGQHEAYVVALSGAGWRPVVVEPADDHPDAVFVEDTLVVVDDVAVVTRPGAPQRRGETAGSAAAAAALGLRVTELAGGSLDGGDVLQVGPTVYVGRGGRTDADGVRALRAALEPLGRVVVPVRLHAVLHLKSALTALPDGTLLGLPGLLDVAGLPGVRVPPEEPGAHVVPLGGGTVLLAASAPQTARWLSDLGFDVVSVDVGEFEKLEGCVTCLGVLVPGAQ
jgi:dimethylargininase